VNERDGGVRFCQFLEGERCLSGAIYCSFGKAKVVSDFKVVNVYGLFFAAC